MAGEFTASYQAKHIELNVGNIMAVGILSLLWWGVANWSSSLLARTTWPVVSQLAVGAQNYLHAPSML
jgi:hypothetical protein